MTERPTRIAVKRAARSGGVVTPGERIVPEEVPIAFSYGGSTHAVMMGTPADLEDFAIGFSLTEGIISEVNQIAAVEIVEGDKGIDVQISLVDEVAAALTARRRSMAGPVGCGLCGIESIEQAVRKVPDVSAVSLNVSYRDIIEAVSLLNGAQPLHRETHAVHGAGFYLPGKGQLAVREDVGRHNALDKLVGALARADIDAGQGICVITSRCSFEMVQKSAAAGIPILVAISAPTTLAIDTAKAAGVTLVAFARGDGMTAYTDFSPLLPAKVEA